MTPESGRASEGERAGLRPRREAARARVRRRGGSYAHLLRPFEALAEPRPGPGGEEEEVSPEEAAALAEYRAACERLGLRGV